jgi:hypothetical protein
MQGSGRRSADALPHALSTASQARRGSAAALPVATGGAGAFGSEQGAAVLANLSACGPRPSVLWQADGMHTTMCAVRQLAWKRPQAGGCRICQGSVPRDACPLRSGPRAPRRKHTVRGAAAQKLGSSVAEAQQRCMHPGAGVTPSKAANAASSHNSIGEHRRSSSGARGSGSGQRCDERCGSLTPAHGKSSSSSSRAVRAQDARTPQTHKARPRWNQRAVSHSAPRTPRCGSARGGQAHRRPGHDSESDGHGDSNGAARGKRTARTNAVAVLGQRQAERQAERRSRENLVHALRLLRSIKAVIEGLPEERGMDTGAASSGGGAEQRAALGTLPSTSPSSAVQRRCAPRRCRPEPVSKNTYL